MKITDKKLIILDMDGTIYLGDTLFPYTMEFINTVKKNDMDFLFFTNNASKNPDIYIEKLSKMGLKIERKNILTSGDVTIKYLLTHRKEKTVYLVGTKALEDSFVENGIELNDTNPDIVMVSFDTSLTYEKLRKACKFIREGSEYMSTHMDINCPTEDGFIPDSGAICALVSKSTGKNPRFFGKPFKETVEMIEEIRTIPREDMIIVGDRLYTDIKTGYINNVTTGLVLSGETKREDLAESEIKPDYVFEDLSKLTDLIKEQSK